MNNNQIGIIRIYSAFLSKTCSIPSVDKRSSRARSPGQEGGGGGGRNFGTIQDTSMTRH